ncbi:MAG: lipopolysaccharide kinase InaA family protein [Isosphaeraceae bacterium]
MKYGSLWERWVRGVSWTWINDRYRGRIPDDLAATVMTLESDDRFHAKQGRSTARFVFHKGEQSAPAKPSRSDAADAPLAVYLKRHYRLPWTARLAALLHPAGNHSDAAAEWSQLERARDLGIEVPDSIAAGERIGPGASLTSFLIVAELEGGAVNELLPVLAAELDPHSFTRLKRRVIAEIARTTARLHNASVFHKDLYLCHFYLDRDRFMADGPNARLALIDLHRLAKHTLSAEWWRWKDLGQLLFSTADVPGITERDRLRFWIEYSRRASLRRPRWHLCIARLRAARYRAHNRKRR